MLRFKASSDLTAAIKNVLGGNNVRCAVAFWGSGAEILLGQATGSQPRIICDVTLGGSSPAALRALGAPGNDCLRHIPGLHAKVYISSRGAIVGSANASRNGIGLSGPANWIEGGVVIGADENSFSQVESWFEEQWKVSKKVDAAALELAAKRFRAGRAPTMRLMQPDSLLDLLVADPDRFSDISIVLVASPPTQAQRDRTRRAGRSHNPEQREVIDSLPDSGMFIGWEAQDLDRWRRTFIELWMPRDRLTVYGRRAIYFCDSEGAVMSRADWSSIRKVVGGELPTAARIAKVDGPMVRRLLNVHGNKLFTANELVAAIEELST